MYLLIVLRLLLTALCNVLVTRNMVGKHNPMRVYSEVNPIEVNGIYWQENVRRIAAYDVYHNNFIELNIHNAWEYACILVL